MLVNGVDSRGVLTQAYGSDALDASLLLAPLMRFLPPDDHRIRATVLAIADELTLDGLVLRYRVEETDDGLRGEEATFAICSFWLVSALAEIGELERARDLCERMLSFASPLGLYARGDRPSHGPSLGQLPPGVHAPGPDQRVDAHGAGRRRGLRRSAQALSGLSRARPAYPGPALHETHRTDEGRACSLSSGIGSPQTSQTP